MIIYPKPYFPKLLPYYYGQTPITRGWRYIVRQRALEAFSLSDILKHSDQFDKNSILKAICNIELLDYIKEKKKKRNATRLAVGLCLRKKMPQDCINTIFTFTHYLESYL